MRTTDTPATTPARNWARLAMAGAVLGGVALLTAACGSSSGSGSTPTTAAGSGGGSTSAASGAGTQVTATLTEYHIALSTQSFKPGTYTFVTKNAGQVGHALEIDGPGVNDLRTSGDLQPGASANLTVTLSAGTYDVFCPVPGHKSLGMDTKITVSGSGAGTAPTATSQPGTSDSSGGGGYGNGY